MLETAHEPVH